MIPDHEARWYRRIVHGRLCVRRRGRCRGGKRQREQPSGRFQPSTRQRVHQLAGLFQCLPGRRRKSIFACFFFRLVQIVQGIAPVRRMLSCRFCILFHDILPSSADTVVRRGTPLHRRQGPTDDKTPNALRAVPALGHSRLIGPVQPYPHDAPLSTRKGCSFPPGAWYGRVLFRTASGDRWGGRQPLTWLLGDSACAESRMLPTNAGDCRGTRHSRRTVFRPAAARRSADAPGPAGPGHSRRQVIRAAIPTAMPGKSRRIPLSSVTRGMPIDLARATNS